jgi:hypothetical protein
VTRSPVAGAIAQADLISYDRLSSTYIPSSHWQLQKQGLPQLERRPPSHFSRNRRCFALSGRAIVLHFLAVVLHFPLAKAASAINLVTVTGSAGNDSDDRDKAQVRRTTRTPQPGCQGRHSLSISPAGQGPGPEASSSLQARGPSPRTQPLYSSRKV